jgi:hypothetical protein
MCYALYALDGKYSRNPHPPSSQEHQNEKDDEKNHQESYHHDLPFPTGLLQNHSHSFLHILKMKAVGIQLKETR